MRGDKNWTAVNEIEARAWDAFGDAFDRWWGALPVGHELHDADYYPDQLDAFFAAHPDGWETKENLSQAIRKERLRCSV